MVLALISAGSFFILNSMALLEKKHLMLNDSFSVAGNTYQNRTVWIDSSGEYIVSFTVSPGTINFSWVPTVEMWLEGQFKPDWIETSQTDYGLSASLGQGYAASPFSFIFLNNDTISNEVHLEVSKVWKEPDYVGLSGGTALVLVGIITGTALKLKKSQNDSW